MANEDLCSGEYRHVASDMSLTSYMGSCLLGSSHRDLLLLRGCFGMMQRLPTQSHSMDIVFLAVLPSCLGS